MTDTVQWARMTLKQLDKLGRSAQKEIVLAVTKLADNPRPHGVKSLVNTESGSATTAWCTRSTTTG